MQKPVEKTDEEKNFIANLLKESATNSTPPASDKPSQPNSAPPENKTKGWLFGAFYILLFSLVFYMCNRVMDKSPDPTKSNVVVNNPYDASVWQVKGYLRDNLDNPGSYEGIEWSPVIDLGRAGSDRSTKHRYIVRHKFTAKSKDGLTVTNNWSFYLDDFGNVISHSGY